MLTLYYKPTCIFSREVIETALQLGLDIKLVDASFDESVIQDLVNHGGKKRVPYLIDNEKNVGLYESKNIVEHLNRNYSGA